MNKLFCSIFFITILGNILGGWVNVSKFCGPPLLGTNLSPHKLDTKIWIVLNLLWTKLATHEVIRPPKPAKSWLPISINWYPNKLAWYWNIVFSLLECRSCCEALTVFWTVRVRPRWPNSTSVPWTRGATSSPAAPRKSS